MPEVSTNKYAAFFKHTLDKIFVVLSVPFWRPLAGMVAVAVALNFGKPIIFRQTRLGLQGKPFQMLKFRTMFDLRDVYDRPLPDEQRLGRFLRATSLDELPERGHCLCNILICILRNRQDGMKLSQESQVGDG